VIAHVSLGVSDLERSARFYDAVFFAVGARRMVGSEGAIAYGIDHAAFWIEVTRTPGAGSARVAIAVRGRAAVDAAYEAGLGSGGTDDGPPRSHPQYGPRYYAAYLRDPDDQRLEIVAGARA
jgi:catechol 2,3-dioxygenase-like lactoylglutathione lyase family enzyme